MDYPKPAGCDIMTMLLLDVEDRATERSDSSAHPGLAGGHLPSLIKDSTCTGILA